MRQRPINLGERMKPPKQCIRSPPAQSRPLFTSVFQIETKGAYAWLVVRGQPGQTSHPRATFSEASYKCKIRMRKEIINKNKEKGSNKSIVPAATTSNKSIVHAAATQIKASSPSQQHQIKASSPSQQHRPRCSNIK